MDDDQIEAIIADLIRDSSLPIQCGSSIDETHADVITARFFSLRQDSSGKYILSPPYRKVSNSGFRLIGVNHYQDDNVSGIGSFFDNIAMSTIGEFHYKEKEVAYYREPTDSGLYSCWSLAHLKLASSDLYISFITMTGWWRYMFPRRWKACGVGKGRLVLGICQVSGEVHLCTRGVRSEKLEILGLYSCLRSQRLRNRLSRRLGNYKVSFIGDLPRQLDLCSSRQWLDWDGDVFHDNFS